MSAQDVAKQASRDLLAYATTVDHDDLLGLAQCVAHNTLRNTFGALRDGMPPGVVVALQSQALGLIDVLLDLHGQHAHTECQEHLDFLTVQQRRVIDAVHKDCG